VNIEKKELKHSIKKGVEYLIDNQENDGSISLNNDVRWKVWETAHTIIAITLVDENNKDFIGKAVNFLLTNQREDGSFSYTITNDRDNYCMETSAVAVLAIAKAKKNVKKGINFILEKQHYDGSWEIGIPGITKRRFWPSITGFVINTLLTLNVKSQGISEGVNYLIKNQKEDGSWGSNWVYYDTPFYPIHIILQSFKLYGLENSSYYKKALNFVYDNQLEDGSWCAETTDKPRPSKALRTSLALNSLSISSIEKQNMKSIEKGIMWLIKNQKKQGNWDGGYFVNWPGKKEDIYTTATAITTIKKYEGILNNKK